MKIVKKIFSVVFILLIVLIAWNFNLVLYGIGQLKGQLHIVLNAKPVEDVLKDKTLNEEYKRKLLLIQEIRNFATDSLGLKNSDNYTTFYDQHNKPILWVVTGCEPFALKPYEWHFPFLGSVSYKGFFIKEKGEQELKRLTSAGYDADIGTVSGWSTLGWFKDPVLSNFLKRPDGVLAETIIHELTHGTVYIKNNVDFNENLATFTGEKGAQQFLKNKYGIFSKELKEYSCYKSDEEIYGNYLLSGAERLDSLYTAFEKTKENTFTKIFLKYKLISEILINIKKLPLCNKGRYLFQFKKEPLPNNTFFMSYIRYRKKQNDFENSFRTEFGDDLKKFIKSYAAGKNSL